jgi:hypothetical protein
VVDYSDRQGGRSRRPLEGATTLSILYIPAILEKGKPGPNAVPPPRRLGPTPKGALDILLSGTSSAVAEDGKAGPLKRLRALAALAVFDPESPRWAGQARVARHHRRGC